MDARRFQEFLVIRLDIWVVLDGTKIAGLWDVIRMSFGAVRTELILQVGFTTKF